MLVPTRFSLPAAEVAGALDASGITPGPGSALPAPAAHKHGAITPELDAALRVAAAPSRELRVRVLRGGAPAVKETVLVRAADRPEVVSFATDGTTFDVVVVADVHQAVVLVDELLSLTDLVAGDGTDVFDLDVPAFAALLALADNATTAKYTARLERRPAPDTLAASPAALASMWEQGLAHDDTRWAVTALRALAPVDVTPYGARLTDGLASLARLGLVTGTGDAALATEHGRYVATVLGQLVVAGSLGLGVFGNGERVAVGPVTILRTATTIWAASWAQPAGGEPTVTLIELTAGGAIALLCDLFEDITPAPAPVAAPAAPAAGFTATHRVPAAGMALWAQPDPAQPAVDQLAGGLEVAVAEVRGAWANVTAADGRTGWVDGRLLDPVG